MKHLSDFHTHTYYCDGKNSPREMILRALELGFEAYGFSGHGVAPFAETGAMSEENEQKYIADILSLKDELSHRIPIFLGVEQELDGKRYKAGGGSPFDYIIGSIHLVDTKDGQKPIDLNPSNITELTDLYFDGDFESLAESYFNKLKRIPERIDASIIAHIDLLSKFCDRIPLTFGERYYEAAFDTVRTLVPYGIPFEINVGAITRGYRSTPYPDEKILRHIRALGGEIIINGDTHFADALGQHLDKAEEYALACGFERRLVISQNGYDLVRIK